jgi:GNAT superfamily N-acetyltransferase
MAKIRSPALKVFFSIHKLPHYLESTFKLRNLFGFSIPIDRIARPNRGRHSMICHTQVEIRREEILSPVAQQLILALNNELSERYPEPGANHFRLDADEVAEGRGAFFVAYLHGTPIGCGAVRRIDAGTAEVKRMYVAPSARGRGVGRQILGAIEAVAKTLAATRLVLETGTRQPEAIALYSRAGFVEIPLFGDYLHSPHPELSLCMAKELSRPPRALNHQAATA